MVETIAERQKRDDFRRLAENFKRCLRSMGYVDVRVPYPLDVLENRELDTKFVIDYGERPISPSVDIRMKAKGVWTHIYSPGKTRTERISPAREMERRYSEAGELVVCEQCGCIDFVKKGEEYTCSVCCQSNTG